jgi:hypothetical protein
MPRVETKIFVFSQKCLKNLFLLFAKNHTKIYENNKNFLENFHENENFYEHLRKNCTFRYNHILTRLFHNFLAEIFATIFEKKMFAKMKIFEKTFAKTKLSRKNFPFFKLQHGCKFAEKFTNKCLLHALPHSVKLQLRAMRHGMESKLCAMRHSGSHDSPLCGIKQSRLCAVPHSAESERKFLT